MRKLSILFMIIPLLCGCSEQVHSRQEFKLEEGWLFSKGDFEAAEEVSFDDSGWQDVTVPHDWAIYGPFDRSYDLQYVAVEQNGELVPSWKTGRTGGLPYVGVGWYRTYFDVDDFDAAAKAVTLYFDGAMSEAKVFVNGEEVCQWPYGYNAFYCDVTPYINADGQDNLLAVRLENKPESSRWYPGAGLYRNVRVIYTDKVHVPVWGTYVTTPEVSEMSAKVVLRTEIAGLEGETVGIRTQIRNSKGKKVAEAVWNGKPENEAVEQELTVLNPALWSPETPNLYKAVTTLSIDGRELDSYETRFGIRSIEYTLDRGFCLNGEPRKFKGVCLHHDLGPLGAAVNEAALRRQLTMLKEMGCDAIRTSHNMPATEQIELCDEMGLMVMIEPFDEWEVAKCENGYHRFFDEWAERDMVNMLHHFRNNPSVVMWSIGNEVPTQSSENGRVMAAWLQDICHREDPTRPVTCGMDRVSDVLYNGFAEVLDIPGFNYRTERYVEAHGALPGKLILGSETASTVSSRGVYKFPVEVSGLATYADHQSSSYDVESCWWSNIPDEDFALADDYDWTIGQFVWTGFDYLGEPSPYDTDAWPSHSSLFGIIDLASIPKDRYHLYRSLWNTEEHTLHMLPHWTWPGREGEVTPVFVYTDYDEAELFVNGKSQGRRKKSDDTLMNRYRLMWNDVVYESGELTVVAYNSAGKKVAEESMRTAGEPAGIKLVPDRMVIDADGRDLAYVRVSIVDSAGNLCPFDSRLVEFEVEGAGYYRAGANGDPTCLDLFHLPQMHAFSGELTAIVQSAGEKGKITMTAKAQGLPDAELRLSAR